jgi:hypothetical protein
MSRSSLRKKYRRRIRQYRVTALGYGAGAIALGVASLTISLWLACLAIPLALVAWSRLHHARMLTRDMQDPMFLVARIQHDADPESYSRKDLPGKS